MKRIWPFRHFGLKIWSVAIATMLWMVVAGEQTVERGLRVPLELQQFPAGLELGAMRHHSSTCGSAVPLAPSAASAPATLSEVLDLRSARTGRRLFQMTPEQIRVPFGVQVVQVTPSEHRAVVRELGDAGGADCAGDRRNAGGRLSSRQAVGEPTDRRGRRALRARSSGSPKPRPSPCPSPTRRVT